jgi:ribosomal-protein-alanine N-acetyltransferase
LTTVRPATPVDLLRLAEIHAEAFDRPWTAAALEALLAESGCAALQVEDGDGVGGFILLRVVVDEAEILTLAVAPSRRRRGFGRALVDAAVTAGQKRGAEAVWLEVAEDNSVARRLYEAAEFDEAGRRKGYYPRKDGAAADAILLRRILNRPRPSAYAAPP